MNQLWAPWRLSYVATSATPTAGDPCFICRGLGEDRDREHLILTRTSLSAVVLNRFPYNNGHLLVASRAHKGNMADLSSQELLDVMETTQKMLKLLDETMHPDGYNVGLNLGRVAGAGLPGHLHWHIVPRWNGDTNFMPVMSDTKVIVQSLECLYDLLSSRLERSGGSPQVGS